MEEWQEEYLKSSARLREDELNIVPAKLRIYVEVIQGSFKNLPLSTALEALYACNEDYSEAIQFLKDKARAAEARSLAPPKRELDDERVKEEEADDASSRPAKRLRNNGMNNGIKREESIQEDKNTVTQFPVAGFIRPTDDEIENASKEKLRQALKAALAHIDILTKDSIETATRAETALDLVILGSH